MTDKTYYEILDVDKDATAAEIKAAWRRLAQQQHPDKGGAHDEFVELKEAYRVLGNTRRRAEYDRTGVKLGTRNVTDTEAAAIAYLRNMVVAVINEAAHPSVTDVMAGVKAMYAKDRKNAEGGRAAAQKEIRRLRDAANRLHCGGAHGDFLHSAIAELIAVHEEQIVRAELHLDKLEVVDGLLSGITYDFDDPMAWAMSRAATTNTTGLVRLTSTSA